jgi:hypothetical protein
MTEDEREWHERMGHQLRGDIVNLAVAALVLDRHGEGTLAKGTRVLVSDLQAQASRHEEAAAKGGDGITSMDTFRNPSS